MTVNLSARNYQLTINELDCTVLLVSIDGGYSHYDSSGLILIDATLILRRTLDWVEDLDDRTNPRFCRGNQIDLKISDSTGVLRPAPILGRLYILKAEYDGVRELKIEAGCVLNLLNFRTPAGDGACLNLGEQKALSAIGAKLLQKAGIFSWSGSISGNALTSPIPKLTNESYIQMFGKLCYANGQFAYQDNLGVVRVEPVRLFSSSIKAFVVGRDDARYERLTGVESPCEIIRVTGTISKTTKQEPYYRSVAEDYQTGFGGTVEIVGKTIYEERLSFANRKKTSKTEVYKQRKTIFVDSTSTELLLAEKSEEESEYEQAPAFSEDNCEQVDEGRLIRKVNLIRKPLYSAMTTWYDNWITVGTFAGVNGDEIILAEKTVSTYQYTKPGTVYAVRGGDADSALAELPKPKLEPYFVTNTQKTIGALLPEDFFTTMAEVKKLASAAKIIETWDEFRKNEWEKETTTYEFFGSLITNSNISVIRKLELALKSRKTERSNSGQATPPAPERFPSPYVVEEIPVNVKVQMPALFGSSNLRPREKEIVLDGGFLTSKAQAEIVGRIEGHILHGKHKGQTASVAVTDEMFAIKPLAGVHWLHGNRAHLFMADGISLAFVNNRLALSFDGIWSGTTVANIPPNTLPEDVPAIINEIIDRDGVAPPYSEIREIELGSGSGLDLKFFPYSVKHTLVDVFFSSGISFLPLKGTEIKQVGIGSGGNFLLLKDAESKQVEIGSGSGYALPSYIGVILGSGSGFSRTNTPTRSIDFGSSSGFFANPEVALLASAGGFDAQELEIATNNLGSGSSLNIAVSPSVSVEFGSGGLSPIDVLGSPNTSIGSGSRFDATIPPSVDIEFGGGLGIDVARSQEAEVELNSGSGSEISELIAPNTGLGSGSGLGVESWDSQLVTHAGSPLVTHEGSRLVAYSNDMSYLALQHEVIDYKNRLLSAGGSISFQDLVAHNILIKELKSANIWNRIQEMYTFSGADFTSALIKFKYLTQPNLINVGIPTSNYSKYIGLRGNIATNGYLLTGYSPLQNLSNGNSHFGVQMQRRRLTGYLFGCSSAVGSDRFGIQLSTGTMFGYTGFAPSSLVPGADFKSFLCLSSIGGVGEICHFRAFDKVRQSTNVVDGVLLDLNMTMFARNINGTAASFCEATLSFFSIGQGLSYSEMVIYEKIVGRFTAAIGRHERNN